MCDHNVKIGDNYGISCHECGVRLEGYGYWAHENKCLHHFVPDGNGDEVCMYCEMWRSTAQHDADVQDAEIEKWLGTLTPEQIDFVAWATDDAATDWRPMTSNEIAVTVAEYNVQQARNRGVDVEYFEKRLEEERAKS